MSKQPEALKLAEELHDAAGDYTLFDKTLGYMAATELRRLHAVNQDLLEALSELSEFCKELGFSWSCIAQARAAIAKAEGESNEP